MDVTINPTLLSFFCGPFHLCKPWVDRNLGILVGFPRFGGIQNFYAKSPNPAPAG